MMCPASASRLRHCSWLLAGPDPHATVCHACPPPLQVKRDFVAPASAGAHSLTLSFMCDSYLGCDQVSHS